MFYDSDFEHGRASVICDIYPSTIAEPLVMKSSSNFMTTQLIGASPKLVLA